MPPDTYYKSIPINRSLPDDALDPFLYFLEMITIITGLSGGFSNAQPNLLLNPLQQLVNEGSYDKALPYSPPESFARQLYTGIAGAAFLYGVL